MLDNTLMALWEDCAEQGLFRYDVTACSTKLLPGVWGFVAQLNEGRASKKRATEFTVDKVGFFSFDCLFCVDLQSSEQSSYVVGAPLGPTAICHVLICGRRHAQHT